MPSSPRSKLKLLVSLLISGLGLPVLCPATAEASYVYRVLIPGGGPSSVCIPGTITESTVDANLAINVAAQGCKTITVVLKGAAGGNTFAGSIGGSGGSITFQLPAAAYAGEWTGVVGQGGEGGSGYNGGNGGGYTSVSFDGTLLGVAGGGGGGGGYGGDGITANGGDGGMLAGSGQNGLYCYTGGAGATDSGPGAAGQICMDYNTSGYGDSGSGMAGGDGESTYPEEVGGAGIGLGGLGGIGDYGNGGGGGGGGGYFGGGGGTDGGDYSVGGGGGGGSDYVINSATGVVDTVGGGAQPISTYGALVGITNIPPPGGAQPPGSYSGNPPPNYPVPSNNNNSNNGNGSITISWQ